MSSWPVEKYTLSPPPLSELVPPLTTSLRANFASVSVSVQACPDLTLAPFHLAARGLCGSARVADIGSQRYLAPTPRRDKKYGLREMARLMELPAEKGLVVGAGAGPFHLVGVNCEGMANLSYGQEGVADEVRGRSWYAKVDDAAPGGVVCARMPGEECGLMANLFGCAGEGGEVLRIAVQGRTGPLNFTDTMVAGLIQGFPDRPISMGGVFVIRNGQAHVHVMPDFPATPFTSRDEVEKWLRFFDMSAPLVGLSVFHSQDPGLDLRMEHTHCFSDHGQGGHYHGDTTPERVEYEAYFNVAQSIYRIDRPG